MEAIGGKTREEKNWIIDSKNFPIILQMSVRNQTQIFQSSEENM
jgi:hypothetical protein